MRVLNPFVYLAAHDLRAPLMSVKGLLYLMRQDAQKESLNHYFNLLETSVNRMNQSISDIIAYSQNESNEINPESVDLRKIAEDSIQSMRYMEGAESVNIQLSVEEGGLFFSDHNCISSIFNNIISNAIRYRDTNKQPFLKIKVTFNSEGVQTSFEDNGIGIDEADQTKIFDKFFRANQDQEGSGVGLYLVKSAVEKLGGSIRIKSKIGEGTTFILQHPNLLIQTDTFDTKDKAHYEGKSIKMVDQFNTNADLALQVGGL